MARSLFGMFWSLLNQSDVDGCHEVSRRVGFEAGIALEMHLDGVTHGRGGNVVLDVAPLA